MTSGFELNQKIWILVHVQLWALANPKKKVNRGQILHMLVIKELQTHVCETLLYTKFTISVMKQSKLCLKL